MPNPVGRSAQRQPSEFAVVGQAGWIRRPLEGIDTY
jgi:hypothetical protein